MARGYTSGKAAPRKATGTASWSLVARPKRGRTVYTIYALDPLGNRSTTVKVTIDRK